MENADFDRLRNKATAIINMFNSVFNTPQGFSDAAAIMHSAGLAGYACHQAVIANHEKFVVVETADKKRFYMGEDLNKYLLEGRYSVLSFCNGFFEHFAKGESRPDVLELIKRGVEVLGNPDYRIWGKFEPKYVYDKIKNCWDGIYDNMTAAYCQTPQEMPILFAIVLQNFMIKALDHIPAASLYRTSLECAIYISKMDNDSV